MLGVDETFDFERPFMPEALVGASGLTFLDADAALALNHVRARGYLSAFGLVEEAIVPFVLEHLEAVAPSASPEQIGALSNFANEELKHITLFRRFVETYDRANAPGPSGNPDVASHRSHVLSHPSLSVGLYVLHIEWMTQAHFVAMVRDDATLEPGFRRLLHGHWLEQSQHARMDAWLVAALADACTDAERREGIEGYLELVSGLAGAQRRQAERDLIALTDWGLKLKPAEWEAFIPQQEKVLLRAYVNSGLTHPRVREVIEWVHPPAGATLDRLASRWS